MASTIRSEPAHLFRLDSLRGAAIGGVLLFHCYNYAFKTDPLPWNRLWRTTEGHPVTACLLYPLTLGWTGISLFFVLSGFVIHFSRLRSRAFEIRTFLWRRFWRIYPTYLAALIFFAALQWHRSHWQFGLVQQCISHVLGVHTFLESTYFGINPSFWTLAIEIQFYLLYPLVLLIRDRWGAKRMLMVALAVSVLARAVAYSITDWNMLLKNSLWANTATLWFDWVLGAYMAEQFFFHRRVFKRPVLSAIGFALLFLALNQWKPTGQLCITIASLFGAVIIEAAVWSTAPASRFTAVTATFGLWSYSFYLWHQPLIPIIHDKLRIGKLPYAIERFAILAAASLVIISVISYVSYQLIERPCQKMGRTKPRFLFRTPANATAAATTEALP